MRENKEAITQSDHDRQIRATEQDEEEKWHGRFPQGSISTQARKKKRSPF